MRIGTVCGQKRLHAIRHLLRRASLHTAHLVGQSLVVAHSEPFPSAVRRGLLQHGMELLDEGLRQRLVSLVNDPINTAEVVDGFEDVVHVHRVIR